jgi:protein-arginine kinase activator protein McsA
VFFRVTTYDNVTWHNYTDTSSETNYYINPNYHDIVVLCSDINLMNYADYAFEKEYGCTNMLINFTYNIDDILTKKQRDKIETYKKIYHNSVTFTVA